MAEMQDAAAQPHDHALSQAYMQGHPAQAARVLESLPAPQAAALLAATPARIAAPVLAAMLPPWAARCLGSLDDARVLELLAPMGMQPAVAVLRHLGDQRRRALAAALPTAVGLASTLLLGYADDSVGAWADPDIVMLGADTRAADALAQLRNTSSPHTAAYVAGPDRRLLGEVAFAALLRSPPEATLATLMKPPAMRLAAHAPLVSTGDHPGWLQSSTLPVVTSDGLLLGVLSHDALKRAQRQSGARPHADPALARPLSHALALGYWQALSGLMELALGLLPRVRPLQDDQQETDHGV